MEELDQGANSILYFVQIVEMKLSVFYIYYFPFASANQQHKSINLHINNFKQFVRHICET